MRKVRCQDSKQHEEAAEDVGFSRRQGGVTGRLRVAGLWPFIPGWPGVLRSYAKPGQPGFLRHGACVVEGEAAGQSSKPARVFEQGVRVGRTGLRVVEVHQRKIARDREADEAARECSSASHRSTN